MGATASTVKTFNEVVSAGKRGETFIPIENLHHNVRIFQHQHDGDIIILADKDGDAFLSDPTSSEYHEIFISRRGQMYLDALGGALSFETTKALMTAVSGEIAGAKPTETAHPPADEKDGQQEKELTLYQLHLRDKPSCFVSSTAEKPSVSPKSKDGKISNSGSVTSLGNNRDPGAKEVAPSTSGPAATGEPSSSISRSVDVEGESMPGSGSKVFSRSVEYDAEFQTSSAFSSLGRSADAATQQSTASSIFFGQEHEGVVRRGLPQIAEDVNADAKSTTSGHGLSPRRNSLGAKDFGGSSARTLTPRLMTSASTVGFSPREFGSAQATAGASPATVSRAESKDSKETPEGSPPAQESPNNNTLPLTRPRDFVPVAYLPPGAQHRKRILEEDLVAQGSPSGRLVCAQSKDESLVVSPASTQPAGRSSFGGTTRSPSTVSDTKANPDSPTPRLSPRVGSVPLSPMAEGKPPSLRSAYQYHEGSSLTHASVSTSALAGIADVASRNVSICPTADCCPVCLQELRQSSRVDPERYEHHLKNCRMRLEMQSALVNIDQNLEPVSRRT
jgi:hypothetical protein